MPCGCGGRTRDSLPVTSGDLDEDSGRFVVTTVDGPVQFTSYREAQTYRQANGGHLTVK